MTFDGFPDGKVKFIRMPEPFFSELLPQIDYLGELKVTIYALWRLEHMGGAFRYLRDSDFSGDEKFMLGLAIGMTPEEAESTLRESLQRAVQRGTLLEVNLDEQPIYFINTPKGRAAVEAIQRGEWNPKDGEDVAVALRSRPSNIFDLYEQNIGPLTPMIAETLRDAEATYPTAWIVEAIQIAVEKNARNWRYVEAILSRWQKEGRYEQEDRQSSEEDRRRYVEGKYADLIE
jgi:DNA replication protein